MIKRCLLLLASIAALLSVAGISLADEAWPARKDLVWTANSRTDLDRTVLGIDTLRLTLASAVFEGEETVAKLAQDRDAYLTLREAMISDPEGLAAQFEAAPPEAIKLSDEVVGLIIKIEDITQSKGIVPNSDLAHVLFAGLRIFLLSAQVNGTDVHEWMCGTYPFSVACE